MASPTQRSLKLLREEGYLAEVVERWVPGARIRSDLFGFGDILAIGPTPVDHGPADLLIVQTTSDSNVSARVKKIKGAPAYPIVAKAMRIEVHGWKKVGGRWRVRRIPL